MQTVRYLAVALFLSLGLAGCGGTVTRHDSAAATPTSLPLATQKTHKATIIVTDEMKAKLTGNLVFNDRVLADMVNNRLFNANALAEDGPYSITITITDVRVRSAFSAVMWGFMAGDDHIVGKVVLTDASQKPVQSFEVKSNYAFGGFAGGQDSVRMSYLYDKFSELVVQELRGTTVPQAAAPAAPGAAGVQNTSSLAPAAGDAAAAAIHNN